jgi:Matrixin
LRFNTGGNLHRTGRALLVAGVAQFSSVRYEFVPAGTTATVSRPDQIVAGRFNGLRRAVNTPGFGGRRARKDGTITAGAILLDRDFDVASTSRRLLWTHELGHALGYNHVHARASIMNPRIGTEPNEFDREAALIAFRAPAIVAAR